MISPLSQIVLHDPPQKAATPGETTPLSCAMPDIPLL